MRVRNKPTRCQEFPDPVEQAAVILEICGGDIWGARAIAMMNVKFARTNDDVDFWSKVEEALSPGMVI
jgi:hypothetical protein